MPKKVAELMAAQVSRLREPGHHTVGGVAGLALQVTKTGARSWMILRVMVGGKRRDMGLGGYPDVNLAQAREAARTARLKISEGIDPIEHGKVARSALAASVASAWTFEACAKEFILAKEPEWRNAKHGAQWRSTLETYAYPVIGNLLVRDVELPHVLKILEPIWSTKTETATRVRSRLENVLDWATTRGYREGLNPARWKGHLSNQLPKPSKVSEVEHHPALPVADIPAFMQRLRTQEGTAAVALHFAILTAARSGEVRGATWDEIDVKRKTWTVPKERMKMGKEHVAALSTAALALLECLPRDKAQPLVFPSPTGKVFSDMSLTAVTRRMEVACVPHGFRASFRMFAAENTNIPREIAEMALAHKLPDKVEASYQRSDLLEKRRKLMELWAQHCSRPAAAKVVPIGKRAASK